MKGVANLVPISMLAILAALFFSSGVHAETSTTQASLEVDSVIDISSPGKVTLTCTPGSIAASAELCTSNASILVTTNNITGYTLQMNITSGNSTNLTNTAVSPSATIPTLSQAYSSANFPINSWGYTGGLDKSGETGGYDCSTNYCPVLAYNSDSSAYAPNHTIRVTNAASTASNTTITFAGKVDTSKPSGTYTSSVTFTAITNYVPHPITNGMSMTDIDYSTCADTPSGTTYTVVDSRDNENYYVAKLADDNCWLLDNLRLDLTNSTVLNSLTTTNTNVDSASLTSLKSGNRAAGDRYASSGFAAWAQGDTVNPYNQAKANADYKNTTTTSYGAGSGKIGVYYNYCAASAGNYCYDQDSGVDDTSTLQDAEYDICPKNWRMPTSTSSGEYQALLTAYNNNQTATDSGSLQYNLSTPLSGYFFSGSADNQGSDGYFWSSTWDYAYDMSYLYVDASNVYPSYSYNRSNGFSVRCMVKGPPQPIANNMYMQDVTQENIKDTPTDITYTLKDERDETSYTVVKLQDGNLWMTQNLELGEYGTSTILDDATSDVSSGGYTLTFDSSDDSSYKGNSNKYGNYYNWSQATAGSGVGISSGEAPDSICPKGWRLPTGSEFDALINDYSELSTPNASQFTSSPLSLVLAGFYYDGDPYYQGNFGLWWSSSAYDNNSASNFYVSDDPYAYTDVGGKDNGFSVRCLMPGS